MRPTLRLSSPAWFAAPRMTSSIALGVDAGPLEQGADRVRGHVVGPHLAQGAAVAAEGRAQAVDDDGGTGWIGPHRADPSTGPRTR